MKITFDLDYFDKWALFVYQSIFQSELVMRFIEVMLCDKKGLEIGLDNLSVDRIISFKGQEGFSSDEIKTDYAKRLTGPHVAVTNIAYENSAGIEKRLFTLEPAERFRDRLNRGVAEYNYDPQSSLETTQALEEEPCP